MRSGNTNGGVKATRLLTASLPFLTWGLALLVPLLVGAGTYDLSRYELALLYILAALGLNVALGYAGQIVLGHSVIVGMGAYASALLSERWGLPWVLAILVASFIGASLGAFMMLPGLRVKGWYLTLITLFAVLLIGPLSTLTKGISGGEFGLSVAPISINGEPLSPQLIYVMIATVVTIALIALYRLLGSDWELRFKGLRDAPRALQSAGVGLRRVKFVVYCVSAVPPALAGALMSHAQSFVNPKTFGLDLALLFVTGVILGGKGTFWGPVIGMIPLLAVSFWLGPFSPFNTVISGLSLFALALLFPNGVLASFLWLKERRHAAERRAEIESVTSEPVDVEVALNPKRWPTDKRSFDDGVALRLDGISKAFGGFQVLRDIEFEVYSGSLMGLIGPNGSGKSTLLNVITGYLSPDSGSVLVADNRVDGVAPNEIAKHGLGRTFQVPQLVPELSVQENIRLGLLGQEPGRLLRSIVGTRQVRRLRSDHRDRAYEMVRQIGLWEFADTRVDELPLGVKRIIEVGRAAVVRPSLLLLDEPATGLNQHERERLSNLVRELCAEGMTVVVIEHNVPFILRTCTDVILLRDGLVESKESLADHSTLSAPLQTYLARVK